MSGFYIRPIEESDKDQWVELWAGKDSYLEFYNTVLPNTTTEATFRRFLDPGYTVWCAVAVSKESGKLIGFVTYLTHLTTWAEQDYMYLNDLFVKEDCRLHGVGRKLIEYVYKEGDSKGVDKVYWCTQMFNHRAQILYNKLGVLEYVLYARDPNYKIQE